MPIPLDATEVLDREFLEIRARLLQVAASLDRLTRAAGSVEEDPRLKRIHQSLGVLLDGQGDRAEQIQLIFSRQYDDQWQQTFQSRPAPRAVSGE